MSDKIKKFLRKLSKKDLATVEEISSKLAKGQLRGLNIVQLKGESNIYRARKGSFRIIYSIDKKGGITILSITRRSEKTYKKF